jgi:hypothetical protein
MSTLTGLTLTVLLYFHTIKQPKKRDYVELFFWNRNDLIFPLFSPESNC